MTSAAVVGVPPAQWTEDAYGRWRRTIFHTAVEAAGLPHMRPYDLRHSFASLLLHEGRNTIYVARQLGHGAGLTNDTYGHVIEELEEQPGRPAEELISEAQILDFPAVGTRSVPGAA